MCRTTTLPSEHFSNRKDVARGGDEDDNNIIGDCVSPTRRRDVARACRETSGGRHVTGNWAPIVPHSDERYTHVSLLPLSFLSLPRDIYTEVFHACVVWAAVRITRIHAYVYILVANDGVTLITSGIRMGISQFVRIDDAARTALRLSNFFRFIIHIEEHNAFKMIIKAELK